MKLHPDWQPVSRVVHLHGGLTAVNEIDPSVLISAGIDAPVLASFATPAFAGLFSHLEHLGLGVIGCRFIQSADEVVGIRPADFRVFAIGKGWPAADVYQRLRNISSTAMKRDLMVVADCAARLAFEVQAVEGRILELSTAYAVQLRGYLHEKSKHERSYQRFDDTNSVRVVLAIHSLFFELAILRDTIAEFLARVVLGDDDRLSAVRSMAKLLPLLAKRRNSDELYERIQAAAAGDADPPGWLAVMSAYRNLFTHVAPLEQVAHVHFVVFYMRSIVALGELPALYHPLPEQPIKLLKERQQGLPYTKFAEWAEASLGRNPDPAIEPDALTYLHGVVCRLVDLAVAVADRSPVAGEMLTISAADIRGPIKVTPGGAAGSIGPTQRPKGADERTS